MPKFAFQDYDEETGEVTLYLPGKMEVCGDCEGHSYVLTPSMRDHCYSQEEFNESFDDEEREQYFTRGGRYDVICPTCEGRNVVVAIDYDECKAEPHASTLKRYEAVEKMHRQNAAMDRAERRAGC